MCNARSGLTGQCVPVMVLGLILVGIAAIVAVADSGKLSRRMPTQVPPRALAVVPFLLGVALIATDLLT